MDSVVSITFPLASIVIVLFLLWNDLLRRRRSVRFVLIARALMCLALGAVLIFNWMSVRAQGRDLPVTFVLIASALALIGAGWFAYRGIRGDASFVQREEEPLPRIFDSRREQGTGTERQDRVE